MKLNLRNTTLFFLLSIISTISVSGQTTNVLDPNDTLVTYDSTHRPVQPPPGKIGKWVRTVRMDWKTDMYKAYIYNGAAFRLKYPKGYDPNANDGKKYPILVFFHGYGEHDSIYDNEYHLLHGADFFNASIENGSFNGYVLFMQSTGYWGADYYQKIQDILNYMIANNKVDQFQILANGLSAGGQGVWESLINYPSLYCVGIPLSWSSTYYTRPGFVDTLKYTPIWLFQGGQDVNPAPYTTHQVRDAFLNAGGNFKYTEIPYAGHDTWDGAWNNMDFFPYLNKAYSSNPWVINGKSQFFTTDTIKATIGLPPGYTAYQWRKDGVVLAAETANSITVNQLGVYDARVQRNGFWSEWSRIPVTLKMATVTNIPAKIEAENYMVMSGIRTEPTADSLGGSDVAYLDPGDYMDYNIHVDTAGSYIFQYRVASPYSDGQFEVRGGPNKKLLATVNVPATGDWQKWKTISDTIALPAGNQTIRLLIAGSSSWNINWFAISKSGVIATPPPPVVTPPVSNYIAIPAVVEAENYNTMQGVAKESTSDAGGGQDVGYIDANDWMDYNVHTADTGTYTISFRVASPVGTAQLQLKKANGAILNTLSIPNTGGWQNWQTASFTVKLDSGDQVLRVFALSGGWNINWISFAKGGSAPPPAPTPTPTPTPVSNYVALPATIESENYVAMLGVAKESTTDAGGGQDVGYIDANDWMDYNVHASDSGIYTLNFRVSSPVSNAKFQVKKADGTVLATITAPNTGGWQNWQTTTTTLPLDSGNQTLRIFSLTGGWNSNWFSLAKGGAAPPPPTTTTTPASVPPVQGTVYNVLPDTIQAEDYTAMLNVQKENCNDAGGGMDVGYINGGSWMDYAINPSVSGTYTVSLRLASPISNAQLQFTKADGTILSTVNIPNTGGWDKWATYTTTLTLDSGNQILRVYSLTVGWNFNWIGFGLSPLNTLGSVSLRKSNIIETPAHSFNVYPNPVRDHVSVELNNEYYGQMKVQVVDMNGSIETELNVYKRNTGYEAIQLDLSNVKRGQHILRITRPGKTETTKIIKL